jgi:CRP-like cAMP-binding protein
MVLDRENKEILNRVILAMSREIREQVLRHCHHVEFPSGYLIYRANAPIEYAYFLNSGLVSLIKSMEDGRSVEIGAMGTEGLVGVFSAIGFDRALVDYTVQVPVVALRIRRKTLQNEMLQHEKLRGLIERYLFLLVEQIAQVAACNRLHSLEERCCRWLLIAQDSAASDTFLFTHEFLATLLGVQRPSLSTTANELQKRGLIRYAHGRITILDRAATEQAACECYRARRRQIDRALGSQSGAL